MGILRRGLMILSLFCAFGAARADDASFAKALAGLGQSDRTAIRQAVDDLGALGDPRAIAVLEALRDGKLAVDANGRVLLRGANDSLTDPLTGAAVPTPEQTLSIPPLNNAVRRALEPALARLQLHAPDPRTRLIAARALAERPQDDAAPLLREALQTETDADIKGQLALALAQLDLNSADRNTRLAAIHTLGKLADNRFLTLLTQLTAHNPDGSDREPDADIRQAAVQAVAGIENRQLFISQAGNLFYGLSLGSVLLLTALGLAITFGLMGVINMAHGELLMIGAYATYVVQNLFRAYLPGAFEWYLLAAAPAAFLASAAVGVIMERSIIRHLYGRPLETLLATWGISLLLIQTVRLLFGAQNVEVANPAWLSGGIAITQGLVLPYNRLATVAFAILVVTLVWLLFQRTRLGLQVRAVTQNRDMAACMGINTAQVDMWTFGLGAGVAGLGGAALSQLGNVGPELGQLYIVDSFMVVVFGGVGKLAGAVVGALGLGMINKFLEPLAGAVLGKIAVLAFIILFIQKRPQGLFALKGRAAAS